MAIAAQAREVRVGPNSEVAAGSSRLRLALESRHPRAGSARPKRATCSHRTNKKPRRIAGACFVAGYALRLPLQPSASVATEDLGRQCADHPQCAPQIGLHPIPSDEPLCRQPAADSGRLSRLFRSAAFSASSRLFDLKGEVSTARAKQASATIAPT
jgi:hypothetical protein